MPTTDTRELHSSHRCINRSPRSGVSFVHVHGSGSQSLRDPTASPRISGPYAVVQAIRAIVRSCDGLLFAAEPVDGNHRAESLFAISEHVLLHRLQYRRLEEERTEVRTKAPSRQHPRPLGYCLIDVANHPVDLAL